jgi:hypothetical protein
MKKTTVIVIMILASLAVFSTAEARTYYRWCSASFRILPFAPGLDPVRDTVRMEPFRARASGGGYIPNTIRERAYRRARNCINRAWADPYNGAVRGVPAECTNSGGNGIYGYNPSPSLVGDMANRACHAWGPRYRGQYILVRVVADVWGDRGCGGHWTRKDAYFQLADRYRLWVPARCET